MCHVTVSYKQLGQSVETVFRQVIAILPCFYDSSTGLVWFDSVRVTAFAPSVFSGTLFRLCKFMYVSACPLNPKESSEARELSSSTPLEDECTARVSLPHALSLCLSVSLSFCRSVSLSESCMHEVVFSLKASCLCLELCRTGINVFSYCLCLVPQYGTRLAVIFQTSSPWCRRRLVRCFHLVVYSIVTEAFRQYLVAFLFLFFHQICAFLHQFETKFHETRYNWKLTLVGTWTTVNLTLSVKI